LSNEYSQEPRCELCLARYVSCKSAKTRPKEGVERTIPSDRSWRSVRGSRCFWPVIPV